MPYGKVVICCPVQLGGCQSRGDRNKRESESVFFLLPNFISVHLFDVLIN